MKPIRYSWYEPSGALFFIGLLFFSVIETGCDGAGKPGAIQVTGEFHVSPPFRNNLPFRILLVIDSSISNQDTDPQGHRGKAAVELATHLSIFYQDVSLGLISFNTEAQALTDGFVEITPDNLESITQTLPGLNTAQGYTNYMSAVDMAAIMIQDDIDRVEDSIHQAELSGLDTTHLRPVYCVLFLSDGKPEMPIEDDMPQETDTILSKVEQMANVQSDAVSIIMLNTAFLSGFNPEEKDGVKTLLIEMANRGNGSFEEFSDAEEIHFDWILPISHNHGNRIKTFILFNRNAILKGNKLLVDSDGDGLADVEEEELGTDPLVRDTDGDILGDGFEVKTNRNPTEHFSVCTNAQSVDSDGDGLNDCEELYIFLDPQRFDTDGDGFVDGIEFFSNADPKDGQDMDNDPESDSVSTYKELLYRTDPKFDNRRYVKDYAYQLKVGFDYDEQTEKFIFQFEASNITLMDTRATSEHEVGMNELIVYFVVYPRDHSEGEYILYRQARKFCNLCDQEGVLDFPSQNFEIIATQKPMEKSLH